MTIVLQYQSPSERLPGLGQVWQFGCCDPLSRGFKVENLRLMRPRIAYRVALPKWEEAAASSSSKVGVWTKGGEVQYRPKLAAGVDELI